MIRPFFWLWIPMIWMAGQLALEVSLDVQTLQIIHSEMGPHECVQFFLIAAGCVLAAITWRTMDRAQDRLLTAWIALATFCCFYVAVEEISWGQSLIHWPTPEEWAAINDQRETNLHNTSRWLNQIPRYGLQIGIVIGGLVLPFALRRLPARLHIFIPPRQLAITAGLLVFAAIGNKLAKEFFDVKLFARSSEVEEIYAFYFVLLYLVVLKGRSA